MARIILRQEAIDDLNDIWDYTFKKWSENQAPEGSGQAMRVVFFAGETALASSLPTVRQASNAIKNK